MISSRYTNRKVFGNRPWEIEIADGSTFEEMVASPEMYVPHHVLEWKYTYDELNEMGRYKIVPAEELIWVRRSVHQSNEVLHKDFFKKLRTSEETKNKLRAVLKGNTRGRGKKGKHYPKKEG